MRAILCRALGAPEGLALENVADPPLPDGGVRIRIQAAAVNYPDLLMVAGRYQHKPDLPFIPGLEAAGRVVEAAPTTGYAPGDRVMVHGRTGAFAEQMAVAADAVLPVPKGFSMEAAAAFRIAFQTADVALIERGALAAGETLLVHGAAGGVGSAAVALGKAVGARVIATIGARQADRKTAMLGKLGADHVLVRNRNGFRDRVKAITDGAGADVIFDPVGGDVFDESMRCIAWGGRLLVIGFAAGRFPQAKVNHVLIKGCAVIGVRAGEYIRRNPGARARIERRLLEMAERHRLRPPIDAVWPLARAPEALRRLAERQVVGKLVLSP